MKIKINEATPTQINWLVAKCEGVRLSALQDHGHFEIYFAEENGCDIYSPSTDWVQGGPILDREKISLASPSPIHEHWTAMTWLNAAMQDGPTPLTAAMRCFVASKLGDEVGIPEELK
jgi:hypothetical protein